MNFNQISVEIIVLIRETIHQAHDYGEKSRVRPADAQDLAEHPRGENTVTMFVNLGTAEHVFNIGNNFKFLHDIALSGDMFFVFSQR